MGKEEDYYYGRGIKEIEFLCHARNGSSLEDIEAFKWIFLRTKNCQTRDSKVKLSLLEKAFYPLVGWSLLKFDKNSEAKKELEALNLYFKLDSNKKYREEMCNRYKKEILPYILKI